MKINETAFSILSLLMKSLRGLDAFTLFKRAKVGFSEFNRSIIFLKESGLLEEKKEDFYKISSDGIKLVQEKKNKSIEKTWKKIPEKMECHEIPADSFYIPSIKLLDRKTFSVSKKDV